MGDSLSSKLNYLVMYQAPLNSVGIRVPVRATADGEGQGLLELKRRWRGVNNSHKQVKRHLNYIHSPDCITDYPKRDRKRRMKLERAGGLHSQLPQQLLAPLPQSASESAPTPTY